MDFFCICFGYIVGQVIAVKRWKCDVADKLAFAIAVAVIASGHCLFNLYRGGAVMSIEQLATIVAACVVGQFVTSRIYGAPFLRS